MTVENVDELAVELELRVDPDAHERRMFVGHACENRLRGEHGMIEPPRRVEQYSGDIVRLQVWIVVEDLRRALTSRQKLQNVDDTDTHPPNTGTSSALLRIECNAL